MECIKMGKIWFFSTLTDQLSLRHARAFAWHAREVWKRLCRKRDPKVVLVPVVLHRDDKIRLGTCIRYFPQLDLLAVCVDFQTVTTVAVDLTERRAPSEPDDPTRFTLRAARIILAEELHHMWKSLLGEANEPSVNVTGKRLPNRKALVAYYAADQDEYEALQFVVEVTGERKELLADCAAYRAEHGLADS